MPVGAAGAATSDPAVAPTPSRPTVSVGAPSTGAVVALKSLHRAKSRLADVSDPLRRRLAWTMAVDTLEALSGAVDVVAVISDEPSLQALLGAEGIAATVVPEPSQGGMNAALVHGEQVLRAVGVARVLASVADLPALRTTTVRSVLTASADRERSFVADASGIGTTMVIATDVALDPRFQGRSAAAHRTSGAHPLADAELGPSADVRRDVDTVIDLYAAAVLGLGRRTAALIDPVTGRLGTHQVITVAGADRVITTEGVRLTVATDALSAPSTRWRTGQRLHAVVAAGGVLAVWL